MMRRLLPTALLLGALLGGATLCFAPTAVAGDKEEATPQKARDYVAELTPAELEFLQERLSDWKTMEPAQRQRLAQNVLRLRNLSEEERSHFKRRVERITKQNDPAQRGGERLEQLKRDGTRMLSTRGLGALARQEMGMERESALLERGITTSTIDMVFSRLFWEQAMSRTATGVEPPAPDTLPAELSEEGRQRYSEAYARYQASEGPGRDKMRGFLAFKYAMMRSELVRHSMARTDVASGDAYSLALGTRLREAWPEAFAAAIAAVRDDPDAFAKAAERSESQRAVESLSRARGRLDKGELRLLVFLSDRAASYNTAQRPELRDRIDALLRDVLVGELSVSAEAIAALPPRSEPEAREEALRQLLRLRPGMGFGPGRRHGPPHRQGPR